MKVKLFDQFLNESQESKPELVVEDLEYYIKEGYIQDPSIKSKEELEKKILSEVNAPLAEFCKKHKISEIKITEFKSISHRGANSRYFVEESEEITGDRLGIFQVPIKSAQFHFFNGGEVSFYNDKEKGFYFRPDVWCTLHLSYKSIGGSNGLSYPLFLEGDLAHNSNAIWYDILAGKWLDVKEKAALEKK